MPALSSLPFELRPWLSKARAIVQHFRVGLPTLTVLPAQAPIEEAPTVYVQRDAQGRLLRVENEPFDGMNDTLAVESEELQSWLAAKLEVKTKLDQLKQSDLEMVRVLEDLVYLLVEQGVIRFDDLPPVAREKLDLRALARAELEGLDDLTKHPTPKR